MNRQHGIRGTYRTLTLALLLAVTSLTSLTTTASPAAADLTVAANRCIIGFSEAATNLTGGVGAGHAAWGPDGNYWIADIGSLIRVSPDGLIKRIGAPFGVHDYLNDVAAGPDGNLWVTDATNHHVGRYDLAGGLTWFTAGISGLPYDITAGPDGNLWFAEPGAHALARITPAGVVTEFPIPNGEATNVVTGPDGNLWFLGTSAGTAGVGRMTPTGQVAFFSSGFTGAAGYGAITAGPDGNLWYQTLTSAVVGRVSPGGTITEFPFPQSTVTAGKGSVSPSITAGPDGNLWFIDQGGDQIVRMTPAGVATAFTADVQPAQIPSQLPILPTSLAAGPDGNLWFTDQAGTLLPNAGVDRISMTGEVTRLGTFSTFPTLGDIATRPDGNLWYTSRGVGRITGEGRVSEYPVNPFQVGGSDVNNPHSIATGPDGNLWITQPALDRIGRLTPAGVLTWFSSGISPGSEPLEIITGPDGNLWFTETAGGRIGRITPAGVVTEYGAGLTAADQLTSLAAGPDGNVWFVERASGQIDRITPAGVLTAYDVVPPDHDLQKITPGPDGALWFTLGVGNAIGRITTKGKTSFYPLSPTSVGLPQYEQQLQGYVQPYDIVAADHRALWFSVPAIGRIGRITTRGRVTGFDARADNATSMDGQPFPLPLIASQPRDLAVAPDGSLWVTGSLFKVSHIVQRSAGDPTCPAGKSAAPAVNPLGPTSKALTRTHLAIRRVTMHGVWMRRFIVRVLPMTAGAATPAGKVTIKVGKRTRCTITLAGGTGRCQRPVSSFPRARVRVRATYLGNPGFQASEVQVRRRWG